MMAFKVTLLGPAQDSSDFIEFLKRTWGRALNNLKAVLEMYPQSY